jgi:6,7-dimethyl-8-ribityllumazine synthase
MTARALIIEARFYDDIADMLLSGARRRLEARGFEADIVTVPGVLEIPPALAIAIASARRHDRSYLAYVVLGCVIRGETGHYEVVAGEGNRAVTDLAVANRLCLGNGILTVEEREQAVVRADPDRKDKGGDAAEAALALLDIRTALRG